MKAAWKWHIAVLVLVAAWAVFARDVTVGISAVVYAVLSSVLLRALGATTRAMFAIHAVSLALISVFAFINDEPVKLNDDDTKCAQVERLVVHAGDPLTASIRVTKKLCAVKATAVTVEGIGPDGKRASIVKTLDVSLTGDDVIELRDDEAHDNVREWSWKVALEFETAKSPALRREFCSAATPTCTELKVFSE